MINDEAIKSAKEGTFVVKVRMTPRNYIARLGKGKDAVSAYCAISRPMVATAAVKKLLDKHGIFVGGLAAREVPKQGILPGLKLKEEKGVSYWRVGWDVHHGGVL
jgi:hypothetical protein